MKPFVSSFVHEYADDEYTVPEPKVPALWHYDDSVDSIHSYPFPRNISDFDRNEDLIVGEAPKADAVNFNRLPRFGFTGLATTPEWLYAGSWNGIYEINKSNFKLNRILSHRLMNDIHGIWTDGEVIISTLPGKDTIVFTDMNGSIVDHFSVDTELNVYKNDSLMEYDWRFLSKQYRGSTGKYHFNYLQKRGNEIWLTSRNLCCFVVVDTTQMTAKLRTISYKTPAEIHDGVWHDDGYVYLTSVDGKVFRVGSAEEVPYTPFDDVDVDYLFDRDLYPSKIRLEQTEFGREPNWCRGISLEDEQIFLNVDGRYGTRHYSVIEVDWEGTLHNSRKLDWKEVGNEHEIRYVTGFDLLLD